LALKQAHFEIVYFIFIIIPESPWCNLDVAQIMLFNPNDENLYRHWPIIIVTIKMMWLLYIFFRFILQLWGY